MSRSACRLTPLVALIVLCGAAAPVCAQTRSHMTPGMEVAPPPGVIGFCRREPEACRSSNATTADVLAQVDAAARDHWRQMFARNDMASPPGAVTPALSAYKANTTTARSSAPTMVAGAFVERRSALWRDVETANLQINAAMRPETDLRIYGQEDYWAIPRAHGDARPVGDCEDFVLAKRERLLALGVPVEALAIALVTTRTGLAHAVLLVTTDEGEYVLDNLSPWAVHWTEARLTWRERQAPGQMLVWTRVVTR